MSDSAHTEVIRSAEDDDPETLARQRHLIELLLPKHPELQRQLEERGWREGWKEGWKEGWNEGILMAARRALRRVLAIRGFPLGAEDDARIDICIDITALERWLDEAMLATSTAEALEGIRSAS